MPDREITMQELAELRASTDLGASEINPPVQPRRSSLPFHELSWKQFEHLCLSLMELDSRVDLARMYGVEGEDQDGIDLFGIRRDSDKAIVFQCKRVEDFGPARIRDVVDQFLRHTNDGQPLKDKYGDELPENYDEEGDRIPHWYERADTFVLCLSRPLETRLQQEAWLKAQGRLKKAGIAGECWDQHALEKKLRKRPELVDLYFHRAWVIAFCGLEAADSLKQLKERDIAEMAAFQQAIRTDFRTELDQGVHLAPGAAEHLKVELADELSRRFAAPMPPLPPTTGDSPFSRDLSRLRTLIEEGAVEAASTRAEELRLLAELETPQRHAEFLRLDGSLLYHQEHPEAADRWLQAFDLDDQPDIALILKGLGHLLRDEAGVAIEFLKMVQRRAPERQDVRSMLASAWHRAGDIVRYEELEDRLTPDEIELGVACARIRMGEKDTAGMYRVLNVLKKGKHAEDPQVRLLLAKAMLQDLLTSLTGVYGDLRTLRATSDPSIPAMLAHLDAAITVFRNPKELWALRLETLNALQVLHSLIGRDDLSVEDGREALQLKPDQPGVQFNLSLALLRSGDDRGVLQMIAVGGEALLNECPQARLIGAAAAQRTGNPGLALELVAPLRNAADLTLRMDSLEERVQTLIGMGDVEAAQREVEMAGEAESKKFPIVELCSAFVLEAREKPEEAACAFTEAAVLASGFERVQIEMQHLMFLRRQGNWKAAAALAQTLELQGLPSRWLEMVIEALYAGEALAAAREAVTLRHARGAPEQLWTLRVEAWLAVGDGDLPAAIRVYQELLRRWPGDARALAEAAATYSRLGRRQRVRELLEQLLASPTTEYQALMHGAEAARLMALEPLAKSLGYRALRLGFNDEQTHVQFFNIMHAFPEQQVLKIVKAETAVQVQVGEAEPRWVVLTADEGPQVSRREYALNDPLALLLLERRVGQSVTLPSGEVQRILKIVSKYENAERVWLLEGRQLFPTTQRLTELRVGALEFLPAGLWDRLRASREQGKEAMRVVREQHVPLGFMMIRRNDQEVRFWDNILAEHMEFTVNTGDPGDLASAQEAVESRKVVLHSSAVMVLTHTNLLGKLLRDRNLPDRPVRQREVLVTRQTIDDLKLAIREAEQEVGRGGRTTMYHDGDRLVMEQEDPQVAQDRLNRFGSALRLLERHARIVPAYGLQAFLDTVPELDHLSVSLSTYLAAQAHGAAVLCDDLNLVRFARFGILGEPVQGATSVLFMDALHCGGRLSDADASAARVKFAGSMQITVPNLTEDDVRALFRSNALKFDWPTLGMLRSLAHRDLPLHGVAQNVAVMVKYGLMQPALDVTQDAWMFEVLTAALGERDLLAFSETVRRALDVQLDLVPTVQFVAQDILERWRLEIWRRTGGREL